MTVLDRVRRALRDWLAPAPPRPVSERQRAIDAVFVALTTLNFHGLGDDHRVVRDLHLAVRLLRFDPRVRAREDDDDE